MTPAENGPTEDPPSRVFKYVKGDLIAKGSYATLYLAMDTQTGELMAVKQTPLVRRAEDRGDAKVTNLINGLKSDIEELRKLDHVNVVQCLGFSEKDDVLNLFLEYVPGGNLSSVIQEHRLDQTLIKYFTGQILDGLAYLHDKGIMHRNINSSKILLNVGGICKITGFTITKLIESGRSAYDDDNATPMQGNIYWMAPEVVINNGEGYSAKVDIWSLGCVWQEMYTRKRPWHGENTFSIILQLGRSRLPPPIDEELLPLPEIVEEFRKDCFATASAERPTAAALRQYEYLRLPIDWQFEHLV